MLSLWVEKYVEVCQFHVCSCTFLHQFKKAYSFSSTFLIFVCSFLRIYFFCKWFSFHFICKIISFSYSSYVSYFFYLFLQCKLGCEIATGSKAPSECSIQTWPGFPRSHFSPYPSCSYGAFVCTICKQYVQTLKCLLWILHERNILNGEDFSNSDLIIN